MKSHSNQNEGIRILEEFVCQAIPNPSLAPSRQPTVADKKCELEVMFADLQPLSSSLVGQDGPLKDRIEIGCGVTLCPQFRSIARAGAVDGNAVLTFLINIPVGIAPNMAAAALYDWLCKHGVRRARVNGIELPVSGAASEDEPVIAHALSQIAWDGESNELR